MPHQSKVAPINKTIPAARAAFQFENLGGEVVMKSLNPPAWFHLLSQLSVKGDLNRGDVGAALRAGLGGGADVVAAFAAFDEGHSDFRPCCCRVRFACP